MHCMHIEGKQLSLLIQACLCAARGNAAVKLENKIFNVRQSVASGNMQYISDNEEWFVSQPERIYKASPLRL